MVKHNLNTWFEKLYEHGLCRRVDQETMTASIVETIREGGLSVCEGGTGIGKSYAGLMAALFMRRETDDEEAPPIVYSTGTIALQEQIIYHDLPALREMLDMEVVAALAKGRGRYMCPKKLFDPGTTTDDPTLELFDDEDLTSGGQPASTANKHELQDMVQAFNDKSWNGDLDAYSKPVSPGSKASITIDSHACLGRRCSSYKVCPYFESRKYLRKCDVIVVNHDLLLSDLALGGGVVIPCKPEDTIYLLDEAHRLPDTAVHHFGATFQVKGSQEWLDSYLKLLNRMRKLSQFPQLANDKINQSGGIIDQLKQSLQDIHTSIKQNSAMFADGVWMFDVVPESCAEPVNALAHQSELLLKNAVHILKLCTTDEAKTSMGHMAVEKIQTNMGFFRYRIGNLSDCAAMLLQDDDPVLPPTARWIDQHKNSDFRFNAFPTFASEHLKRFLWDEAKSAIAYSATLRALGSFDRFLQESGLSKAKREVGSHYFLSPFHYELSTVYVTANATHPNDEGHEQLTANILAGVVIKGSRGVLALFTSSLKMHRVREILEVDKNFHGAVLMQTEMSKASLIATHREMIDAGQTSVILGLTSFSEGVDLPGDYCTTVVIPRIPFAVPSTPMEKARLDWIDKSGGHSFSDYTLPMASIRFTQMSGRLIRTEHDVGNVIVLDPRICTKVYGKLLLRNLPGFTVQRFSSKSYKLAGCRDEE